MDDRVSRALYCVRHRDTPKVFPVTVVKVTFSVIASVTALGQPLFTEVFTANLQGIPEIFLIRGA